MILCIDVGNSNIYGGVFSDATIQMRFRYPSNSGTTSDQLGVFFKSVLHENAVDASQIQHIAICSVVPDLDYSLRSACRKYFEIDPFFLQAGVKTGLKIKYRNPIEVGADRISTAMAAVTLYPDRNIIIVDLGTATVFCAVTKEKDYLGGAILPGMRISMLSLQSSTAKLPPVEILRPDAVIGRSAVESIQSGLYYSHLGGLREIISRIQKEHFADHPPVVIGTGGFSHLFEKETIFTEIIPDLVLLGLRQALHLNAIT